MGSNFILEIYKNVQTVFTAKEMSLLFPKFSSSSLKNRIHYAVKTGKLVRLRKGVYAKQNYDPFELANKVYTPSYISLETVLEEAGVIFQHYETIFVASYLTRRIKVAAQEIFYRKLKDEVLLNPLGIENKNTFFIASPERAFLDALFLYKDYHFDNLTLLDWEKIMNLKTVYQNTSLEYRVKDYYKSYKQEYA